MGDYSIFFSKPLEKKITCVRRVFISKIKVHEDYPEVQSIDLHISNFPIVDGKLSSTTRRCVTNCQYALTIINLLLLSKLILASELLIDWYNVNEDMLVNLLNDGSVWLKNSIERYRSYY